MICRFRRDRNCVKFASYGETNLGWTGQPHFLENFLSHLVVEGLVRHRTLVFRRQVVSTPSEFTLTEVLLVPCITGDYASNRNQFMNSALTAGEIAPTVNGECSALNQ